jgi:hypothetical protein
MAKSFLLNEQKESNYLLTVTKDGAETTISVTTADTADQSGSYSYQDGYYEEPVDISQELLKKLYKTIQDDLVEE